MQLAQAHRLRAMLLAGLRDTVSQIFDVLYEQNSQNALLLLQAMSQLDKEASLLDDAVTMVMPSIWDVSPFFTSVYQDCANDSIRKLIVNDPSPDLFRFIATELQQRTSSVILKPSNSVLVEHFTNHIVQKLDEWCMNLMRSETQAFTARTVAPETDADNTYSMHSAVIISRIFNQQAEHAIQSGDKLVFTKFVLRGISVLERMQAAWISLIDVEIERYLRPGASSERTPGLVEYAIALANDQFKCSLFTTSFEERYSSNVTAHDRQAVSEAFAGLHAGYESVSTHCSDAILSNIGHDIKPAAKELFSSDWLESRSSAMAQILETIRDYLDDCREHLLPAPFAALVLKQLDDLLVLYLHRLIRAKNLKTHALNFIRDDITSARALFVIYMPAESVSARLQLMDRVIGLLGVSKNLVVLEFWSFAKEEGPNLSFVEAVLRARDDMDWVDVAKIMQVLKRKVQGEPQLGLIRLHLPFCC